MSDRRTILAMQMILAGIAFWRVWRFFADLPIAAPFQYDYEEGNILNALLRITQGHTPYPDPHALPNIINPYGPAAYYLLVSPVKVFGLAFVYPRALIVGCAIVIVVLIVLELRRATNSLSVALTFALIFLSVPNIQEWAWLLRVDLLGIVFTVAGLVFFAHYLGCERPATVFPGLLFALGLLVKPTLVAAPAACFFALLARRRFRDSAKFTGVTLAAFGLVMAVFAASTRGAVLTDVFLSHPDPFSFRVFTQGLTQMLVMSWPLVALAVIAIAHDVARRRFSPSILWLLFATATAVTAGKLGSNQNHFLEWNAALCLAAGLGLHKLISLESRPLALMATAAAIASVTIVSSRQPHYLDNRSLEGGCPAAYEWVRTQAGPNLLSENVGALALGNKKVWVSNPFVLAQLVEHAGWSDADLVLMVRQRRFDAILTRLDYPAYAEYREHGAERFSPAVIRAIAENYQATSGFDCRDMVILYKPKDSAAIQSK